MARPLVYVAGSTKEIERVRRVQRMMKSLGYVITFDWTGIAGEVRDEWTTPEAHARGGALAAREITACVLADLIVVCCPEKGLGCWVEMGAGLASGVPVLLVAPQRESVFFAHPAVTVVEDEWEIVEVLNSSRKKGGISTES